jgi:hypothetical protein
MTRTKTLEEARIEAARLVAKYSDPKLLAKEQAVLRAAYSKIK